jgi:4-amino-4-deoxy-L-arabinose transferase-like glycosyltransferase
MPKPRARWSLGRLADAALQLRESLAEAVLYYWLTAAVYRVTGPAKAPRASGPRCRARAWCCWSGPRAPPRLDAAHAWLAGAITATCYGYFAMARSALPDLPLAFCITLTVSAVFAAFDARGREALRWWLLPDWRPGSGA